MEDILEVIKQNWYVIAAILAITVLSVVFNVVRLRKAKKSNRNFLEEHPDAAKIYLTTKALITAEAVEVYSVNGAAPEKFFESGKSGFYLLPGQSLVELNYTYTRPGVMYKNVTKSTGVVKKTLEVQAYTGYVLGFDRKAEEFTFETAG